MTDQQKMKCKECGNETIPFKRLCFATKGLYFCDGWCLTQYNIKEEKQEVCEISHSLANQREGKSTLALRFSDEIAYLMGAALAASIVDALINKNSLQTPDANTSGDRFLQNQSNVMEVPPMDAQTKTMLESFDKANLVKAREKAEEELASEQQQKAKAEYVKVLNRKESAESVIKTSQKIVDECNEALKLFAKK